MPFQSIGRVVGDFKFQAETRVFRREFHVLRKSVYGVVLGRAFLDQTKTLIQFCHRIVERIRPCLQQRSRLFLLDKSPCLKGRIRCAVNGAEAAAFPDTGSDLMLVSGDFCRRNKVTVHRGPQYEQQMELIDGSTIRTNGVVFDAELEFDVPPVPVEYNEYFDLAETLCSAMISPTSKSKKKSTFVCELHVIDDLPCDVVLSSSFIFSQRVFVRFGSLFSLKPAITTPSYRISLQGPSWEACWDIEEARRNSTLLRISILPKL
ncbi:hypothetical protein B0T18DRAFT_428743 [Schizothecium vesticola]|uniref:Uncharacterized protein n=1 Tax=Schizothecium vesticola TaxID=314040 RepID=A0AA40K4R9_9PEZI|nr:hypothetical protein B0T18DRAFT_428743 [Schizothecium vesticola]